MKLSRKKAIALCIELWEWLAKTGKKKEDWPNWEKYGDIQDDCWFCEYATQRRQVNKNDGSICIYCPYYKKIGIKCFYSLFDDWDYAKTPLARKKYAKLFLEQIKSIE